MAKTRHRRARRLDRLPRLRRAQPDPIQPTRPLRDPPINLQTNCPRLQHNLSTRRHRPPPHWLHRSLRLRQSPNQEIHLRQTTLPIPWAGIKQKRPRVSLGHEIRRRSRRLPRLRSMAVNRTRDASDAAEWIRHAHWRVVRPRRLEQRMQEPATMDVLLHESSSECKRRGC
jgi:hypothetical protein